MAYSLADEQARADIESGTALTLGTLDKYVAGVCGLEATLIVFIDTSHCSHKDEPFLSQPMAQGSLLKMTAQAIKMYDENVNHGLLQRAKTDRRGSAAWIIENY